MASSTYVSTRRATHQEPLITARFLGRGVVAGLLSGVVLAMIMTLVIVLNGCGFCRKRLCVWTTTPARRRVRASAAHVEEMVRDTNCDGELR